MRKKNNGCWNSECTFKIDTFLFFYKFINSLLWWLPGSRWGYDSYCNRCYDDDDDDDGDGDGDDDENDDDEEDYDDDAVDSDVCNNYDTGVQGNAKLKVTGDYRYYDGGAVDLTMAGRIMRMALYNDRIEYHE